MKNAQITILMSLLLGLVCLQSNAQESSATVEKDLTIPVDEFDRGTPQRSADGFMRTVDKGDYETAAQYLDLHNLRGRASELTGAQLARRFFVIIKRADWVDINELVDDPAGRSNDNLPAYRDSLGIIENNGKETRLYMQKVLRGDGVSIWKISNATVSLIPKLYVTYGYPEIIEELRRNLPNKVILGYELFKWVVVGTAAVFAYVLIFLIALVTRRLLGDPNAPSHRLIFRFLVLPFGIWLVILTMNVTAISLGSGATAEAWQRLTPVPILLTVWMMFAATNLLQEIYSTRLQDRGRRGAAVLLGPAGNAIKILIGIAAILLYMDKLGVNITTVLAGLGVGGIAVALALQKPMEDVFGAFTLYTQQPVRVGDFCRIGDQTGTIEEIGLRTTLMRTLANTVIAIPNAQLANQPIDNISARKKILFKLLLRLRYDTTPEQLQRILDEINELLSTSEHILRKNQRARFKEIADDALLVEINAYLNTTEWAKYLELVEQLNMRILKIVSAAGASLYPPARMLYVEQSGETGTETLE
jgi:MscS family membrane protein